MKKTILTVIGAVLISGCSTTSKEIVIQPEIFKLKPVMAVKTEKKERPSWVLTGSGVSLSNSNESKDTFIGVGVKKYSKSPDKVRMDVNDAARNSLIRVLDNFNRGLIRYHQAVKDPREPGWVDKEKLQNVINNTTAILLLDSKIVDHWDQSDSKKSFSLARLDFKKFQMAISSSNYLNADEKTSIKFISKWVFKNMQMVRERKFLFSTMNQTIAME
jgi:hypothetical protein